MAQISSEVPDASSEDESAGSEARTTSSLCDHTFSEDSDLRSMIEERAFQVLSRGSLEKRPNYASHITEPDEENDFPSLNFPRKLWKLVESEKFRSIWWDEAGTSVVINEERFKKEVLERKTPFRIFETYRMKSFIRQLNLYGFSKLKWTFQRSASLTDFLAEENEASVLNKLQFYQHPNFKRGCPQLLIRMKRRVRTKNACPASPALVPGFSKKNDRADDDMDDHSGLVAETSEESLFSTSPNLNVPLRRKASTCQSIATTTELLRRDLSPPSSTSVRPSEQAVINQRAISHQLATVNMISNNSYTQASGPTVNIITTATSQYHIISPFQDSYVGMMMQPSVFLNRYPAFSANEAPVYSLIPTGIPWFSMLLITDAPATLLSSSMHQPPSLYQHHPDYN
ncbi:LOW QUALITY PROTEIN: heat shock transcription factor, Y-linked-like [Erethizon dorsatum]